MAAWFISVLLVSAAVVLIMIGSIVFVFNRRDMQPLKFRGALLLCCSGTGALFTMLWLVLFLLRSHTPERTFGISHHSFCKIGGWVVWVCYPLLVVPYILRVLRLYRMLNSHSMDNLVANPQALPSAAITEMLLLKMLVGIVFVCVCVKVMLDVLQIDIGVVGFTCTSHTMMAWAPIHLFEILLISISIYQFGVVSEFMVICIVWVVGTASMAVANILETDSSLHRWLSVHSTLSSIDYDQVTASIVIARNFAVVFVSLVWPAYRSQIEPFVPLWSSCDALRSLDLLLKDIVCIQYFRQFLTHAMCIESILCWVEIELYKDMPTHEQLQLQALRIYDKYVRPEAELEVSVPHQIRVRVARAIDLDMPNTDTFAEVQHELFLQMNQLFPQFLTSDSGRECFLELEKEEHMRELFERSGMI